MCIRDSIRPNAMAKACGVCDYGDDVELHMPAETLKVELVQPRKYSHAKIVNIDYSEAEKMPGVVDVYKRQSWAFQR